jgi:hypothetical protein
MKNANLDVSGRGAIGEPHVVDPVGGLAARELGSDVRAEDVGGRRAAARRSARKNTSSVQLIRT